MCEWPDCGRIALQRGFCPRCAKRAESVGNYEDPWLEWRDTRRRADLHPPCRWPGCTDLGDEGRGLCCKHWSRAKQAGNWAEPWVAWKSARSRECGVCGSLLVDRFVSALYCSPTCSARAWRLRNPDRYAEMGRRHASRRRARIAATTVEDFTEADVRMAHGDDCYLCGDQINFKLKWPHPKSPSLDHVVPLSAGGTHTLDNVAMTCLSCNHSKNARPAASAPIPTLFAP